MNNSSSCSNWSPAVVYVRCAYISLLLALGLLLNGLALWVFCCRQRRWTETHVYMTNLAVADLCLLCDMPFMLLSMKDNRQEDTVLCQVSQSIYLVNRYMSISLVMAIAVDRYLAVRHPLWARGLRSPRQAAAVCAALWLLVVGSLALRWALKDQEGGFCFTNRERQSRHSSAVFLLGFYLPLAVLVFCSLQVVWALRRRPASDARQAEATRKAIAMVCANLAVFVVCFLPLYAVLTWRLAVGRSTCATQYAFYITGRLSDANCCLDAICYYFMAREFQASAQARGPWSRGPEEPGLAGRGEEHGAGGQGQGSLEVCPAAGRE